MEKNYDDIGDDEIRFLGCDDKKEENIVWNRYRKRRGIILFLSVPPIIAVLAVLLTWFLSDSPKTDKPNDEMTLTEPEYYEETVNEQSQYIDIQYDEILPEPPGPDYFERPAFRFPLALAAETGYGFIEIADTIINDIPIRLYLPHHVSMSLHLGAIDRNDSSIVFATQAADVRADNGGIVGAFVLKGEPKAWGLSKKGFCAIINDTVTVGVADNSPLFEEATEKEGYFFRQFPLVHNGQLVENEQRGKSIRRALCDRNGEIFTVETLSIESIHDFAQALADLGVDQAIYLVGSDAYGWATDAEGQRHEFGNPDPPKKIWENISYLMMRNKD